MGKNGLEQEFRLLFCRCRLSALNLTEIAIGVLALSVDDYVQGERRLRQGLPIWKDIKKKGQQVTDYRTAKNLIFPRCKDHKENNDFWCTLSEINPQALKEITAAKLEGGVKLKKYLKPCLTIT